MSTVHVDEGVNKDHVTRGTVMCPYGVETYSVAQLLTRKCTVVTTENLEQFRPNTRKTIPLSTIDTDNTIGH